MAVTVNTTLAGPLTARFSNIYGALANLGLVSSLGAQDVTGSGDPVAGILNASEFYAPLTHSLILTRGTGNPTYSRATNAWEFDNEGKLILVPSGAARFGGARFVRNLWAYSETPTNAYWEVLGGAVKTTGETDPFGGTNAAKITINAGRFDNVISMGIPAYSTVTLSYWAKANVAGNVGCGYLGFTPAPSIAVTTDWQRVQTTFTVGSSVVQYVYPVHAVGTDVGITDVWLYGIQVEIVTGQADQTASEYVSTGVLSAPYHGAGVDGCKWFNTNKDGSAISASSLLGYHAEGARTNSLLYSRDLRGSKTGGTGPWVSPGNGTELIVNGGFDADTNWTHYGTSISGGVLVFASQPSGSGAVQLYSVSPGLYKLTFDISGYTSGSAHCDITGYASFLSFTANGTHTEYIYVSASTASFRVVATAANTTLNVDNVSIQRCAIQPSTCTGIDNAANSASTLTAGAANATILQTLTLAAAARSFSAYVKRRTGTGNVYITRDGGTNWTDITSLINSSTWTRVKIENTSVLNPQVGFKIATSGDAIDVDVCQDEAGAFASSPIITTTAAVTRNDDDLYYANGNVNNAEGAVLVTGRTDSVINWGLPSNLVQVAGGGQLYLQSGQARTAITAYDGTAATVKSGLGDAATDHRKFAVSYAGAAMLLTGGGQAPTSGSFDGSWGTGTAPIIGGNWFGYIKDTYIWQSALTDAQLQQVTT